MRNKIATVMAGFFLLILGVVALISESITTYETTWVLGMLLLLGGIAQFLRGFLIANLSSAFMNVFSGILSFVIGILVVANTSFSVVSFTLFLSLYFIVSGTIRVVSSIITPDRDWGWSLFGGIASLLLGILVVNQWPTPGLFLLSLFLGIDLILSGMMLVFLPTHPQKESRTAVA